MQVSLMISQDGLQRCDIFELITSTALRCGVCAMHQGPSVPAARHHCMRV